MSDKDKVEKILEDFNDVFADIFNTLIFKKKFLKEDQLYPSSTESICKAATENSLEQRRDILKMYMENSFQILSIGIENQASQDKYMPIRIMGYDYTAYREMISNKRKLIPVITIVLNFTDKKWSNAKSIHELLKLPDELKDVVSNYHIMVYDIAYLDDDTIESFTSDFRLIARFFKYKRLGLSADEFFNSEDTVSHIEAFLDFLTVFTKDTRYRELTYAIKAKTKEGELTKLCYYYDTIEQRGITKGISQGISLGIERGRRQAISSLFQSGIITLSQACEQLNISEEEFLSLEPEYQN